MSARATHRPSRRRLCLLLALGLCALASCAHLAAAAESARASGLLGIEISLGQSKSSSSTESSDSKESSGSSSPVSVSISSSALSGVVPPISVKAGPVQGSVDPTPKTSSEAQSSGSPSGSETVSVHVETPAPAKSPSTPKVPGASEAHTPSTTTSTQSSPPASSGNSNAPAKAAALGPGQTHSSVPAAVIAAKHAHGSPTAHRGATSRRSAGKPHGKPTGDGATAASTPHRNATVTTPPGAAGRSHAAKRTSRGSSKSSDPLSVLGRQLPALGLPVPDWSRPIILALLILSLILAIRAIIATRRTRRLEQTQSALVNDLLLMQSALVPEVPAQLGGLAISASYRPAEGPAAGGDFYDVFGLADGRVAMILGDVCGHGHEALEQAALTRYTVRAYLEAGLEPGAALALASEVMSDPNFEHYATVIAAIYDETRSILVYSSAGHPPPLTANVPGRESVDGFASPPVGWGVRTGQRQSTLELSAGTQVCFFSDGLIEARTDSGLLGREGLREKLESLGEQASAEHLLGAVRESATRVSDDMAACIISPLAAAPAANAGRSEELEIDDDSLSSEHAAGFLEACGLDLEPREEILARVREMLHRAPRARLRVKTGGADQLNAEVIAATRSQLDGQPPASRLNAHIGG
jgi:hypothetical protein